MIVEVPDVPFDVPLRSVFSRERDVRWQTARAMLNPAALLLRYSRLRIRAASQLRLPAPPRKTIMLGPRRLLTLAAGYATGAVVLAWGTYLFWLPGLSQEQVLLTGLPLVGGIGLMVAAGEFQRRTAARSV